MMVMQHNGDRRCPYCASRQIYVVDYDLADPKYAHYGSYWFKMKCKKCGGTCTDINNLETKSEKLARLAKQSKEAENNESATISTDREIAHC